jgi:hypothetical protein
MATARTGGSEEAGFSEPDEAAADLADALEAVVPPSHYIAMEPLFLGGNAETMPARAYNPGDRVLPADVERFGWQDRVTRPEDQPAPKPPRVPAKDTAKDTAKSPQAGQKDKE